MFTFIKKAAKANTDAFYVQALERVLSKFNPNEELTGKERNYLAQYKVRRFKAVFRPFG